MQQLAEQHNLLAEMFVVYAT